MAKHRMRVTVRGKTYKNVLTCAKALKVSKHTVYSAITRNATETLGLGPGTCGPCRGGLPRRKVKVGRFEWDSIADAAKDLGYDKRNLQRTLSKGGKRAHENLVRRVMEFELRSQG